MYSPQIRAARGLLDWTQEDLAQKSGVSSRTVKRLEEGQGFAAGQHESVALIQQAMERAGVVFLSEPGQIGVVLRIKAGRAPPGGV